MKDEKILLKLDEMEHYLIELENMLPTSIDDYVENLPVKRGCEKTVELAIEAVISILSMLIAARRLGVPTSEESIIQIAEKSKVLSSKVIKRISEMKGFRNILVHKYGEIEDERVFEYLNNELGDFTDFKQEILKFLKK